MADSADKPVSESLGRAQRRDLLHPRDPGSPQVISRFVVITGGPGSGKTSLVTHLAWRGYAIVPEAAIQIIDELNHEYGVPGQIEWRQQHPIDFQWRVIERQARLEAACKVPEGRFGFCDRGRPDNLAYAELVGVELDSEFRSLIEEQRYLRVFLLDTLSHFEVRTTTGRMSDRARSVRIHDLLYEVYGSLGYSPSPVPELPIEDRARFVLSELEPDQDLDLPHRLPERTC